MGASNSLTREGVKTSGAGIPSEVGRRVLTLPVVGGISGRATTRREGDERSCGDWPEGVNASGSRGGRGLEGSVVGTCKG